MSKATFRGFVTSATAIERSQWKIRSPMNWAVLDEEKAQEFIRTAPVRDRRANMEKNRFRILVVQSADRNWLCRQYGIINAARDAKWIGDEFAYFIEKGTSGSTVIETEKSISLIAQTPQNDIRHIGAAPSMEDMPYFSFAITELDVGRPKGEADWTCLLFADDRLDVERLICSMPFPSDFPHPMSPDLFFLSASLLQWQVEQTRDQVNRLTESILAQDENWANNSLQGLETLRSTLFQLEKSHLMLHRRWLFEQDLAANLLRCFQIIETQETGEEQVSYPQKLRQHVKTQNDLSTTLRHDLDTTPGKIKFQHAMIDSQISISIAKNSQFAAKEARRDSLFMKTIAIITLLFLPGTFVAAVFSMSMFDWGADGAVVVSKHVWMYFAITIPLTVTVMIGWVLWTMSSERKYKKRSDLEYKIQ